MATNRASGGLDHLTAVPENFDPDASRGDGGADGSGGQDDASGSA